MVPFIIAFIVIVAVILIASALQNHDSDDSSEADSNTVTELPGKPLNFTWEKNYFINQHLHRDDKAKERHKRNQFPF